MAFEAAPETLDSMVKSAALAQQAAGLQLAMNLPTLMVEELTLRIDRLKEELNEQENDNGN